MKIRWSEINKHVSDGINKDSENQKGTAKNLAFLQKEIDTRNLKSLQRTVLMMMKRTTEQITDVTRGNTAALVGVDQFF